MVSAEASLKIYVHYIQLTSVRAGDTYIVTVQGKGFRRLLSADKLMFRLRKAIKVASKLLRPFVFCLNIQKSNCFYKLQPFSNICRSATDY